MCLHSRIDRPADCRRAVLTPLKSLLCLLLAAVAVAPPVLALNADLPETPTFNRDVAPIFFARCVSCHRPGDVAPMSLLSYEEARPWAKAIRRVVAEREMPPWDADSRYGVFSNDISLSQIEIAMITRWVDQGAQAGDSADLPARPELPTGWKMGREPDAVIELAQVDVPAAGEDLFLSQVYGLELPEERWVAAIELLPGNTQVLHHVVTYLGPFGMDDGEPTYLNEAAKRPVTVRDAPSLGAVWVAGAPPSRFREGTGHTLEHDQILSFNLHYHPNGTAGSDRSKVGLYFGEGELEKEITTSFAADTGMWIPAGAADHREQARYLFSQDSRILSFLPHMHQRGKSMTYTLKRPDGTEKILLQVPEYDYDWQNIYLLQEPIAAPAGSLLEVEASWDNSAGNPANPDPTADVPWGDGTNREMLVAFFDFIVDEGKVPAPVKTNEKIDELLDLHPAEHAYRITLQDMTFGGGWGLVVPPQGEGTFYMSMNSLMFSTSIPEVTRVGSEVLLNGSMVTSAGGAVSPLGFLARQGADGSIEGEIFFGQELTAESLESMRGQGRRFTGMSRAAAASGRLASSGD